MNLVLRIRELFAEVKDNNAVNIDVIGGVFPAWVIRYNGWYGVGIPNINNLVISERFSNVRLWNQVLIIDGSQFDLLILSSEVEYLRHEFASICAEFSEPGVNGNERKGITDAPFLWWEKWKTLLGNSVHNKAAYSVLGELLVYKYLLENSENPIWAAINKSTHDIETENDNYEVKSTIKRYETTVTISSQYQLKVPEHGLNLCFCRFEEAMSGVSIEDVLCELGSRGVDVEKLNKSLEKIGYEEGTSSRYTKYKILEMREYKVNEQFPLITCNSFKESKLPDRVIKFTYEIDLNGLDYSTIQCK